MIVLHHHPFLAPCRFVRLVLGEHAVPFEAVLEPFWEERAEFAAVNPGLMLPMAFDDGRGPLIGPGPIMEYVEERHGAMRPGHRLLPADPFARAEVRRLVDWFVRKFDEEVSGPLVMERILKVEMPSGRGGGAPDSQAMRTARANAVAHAHYVGALAAGRKWLAGDQFSYADLAAAAAFSVIDYLGEAPWAADPAVKAWYQKLKSRPAFRPLLSDKARLVPAAAHYADLDF